MCSICKKGALHHWKGSDTRLGVEIAVTGMKCDQCAEVFFDDEETGRQESAIAAGLVTRGIRAGAEFKFVRKIIGLKGLEVAQLLDVRPETVSRWESGDASLPRSVAFILGELFDHPKRARQKLEALASYL